MPGNSTRVTAGELAALWDKLRPFAILVSIAFAIVFDALIGRALWDRLPMFVALIVLVLLFLPLMFGTYAIFSAPMNFWITAAPTSRELEELEDREGRDGLH